MTQGPHHTLNRLSKAGKTLASGVLLLVVSMPISANRNWKPYPLTERDLPDLSGDNLLNLWPELTRATRDPKPNDTALLDAWRSHFKGDFAQAKEKGLKLGTPEGMYVAYRAQTVYAMYIATEPVRTWLLEDAANKLIETVEELKKTGKKPSPQIVFWGTYALGRYIQSIKWLWEPMEKKTKVRKFLALADSIDHPSMPAKHGLLGGAYAEIYQDGIMARLTFRNTPKDCQGQVMTGQFAQATKLHFDYALKALGEHPFPEIYNSYAKALLDLDPEANEKVADDYRRYAAGSTLPFGVTNMIFSAEDALAKYAAEKELAKSKQPKE